MIRQPGGVIRFALILGLALGLFFAAGCEDEEPEEATGTPVVTQHESSTGEDTVQSLAAANSAFAFDLYNEIRSEGDNLFFSPYSVSSALAMTLAGAAGDTATQIRAVLHFDFLATPVHAAFGSLDETLNERSTLPEAYEGEGFELHVVNAIWPQLGYALLDAFLETVTENYGAELRDLDYATDPDGARRTINDWVSERTEEKIEHLIPEGAIDPETRLVLTNAIYFNAPWMNPFDPDDTVVEPFTLLSGETVDAEMMHLTESLPYAAWDDGIAFELPYNGEELAMVVLVPNEGAFDAFDASLSPEVFDGIVESFDRQRIALGFPRFEFEYAESLVPALRDLGMIDAFDGERADFSRITGSRDLAISDVLHKAFVSVDEAGTEAAAATAVVFRATGMPAEPLPITVDRPFLFVIRDRPTGTILFVGRVLDP